MSGTKVTVKVAWGQKAKSSSIKISAKTLGDALTALQKLDEWGKFEWKLEYSYKGNATHVTEVTLKPSYTIAMPAWSGYSKAPKECQKEWDKMWKKLDEHEEGHVEVLEKTVDWTKGSLEKMTDLTVETLKAAVAHEIVHGNENQKAFDDATGHGSKKGVVLNVSAACA